MRRSTGYLAAPQTRRMQSMTRCWLAGSWTVEWSGAAWQSRSKYLPLTPSSSGAVAAQTLRGGQVDPLHLGRLRRIHAVDCLILQLYVRVLEITSDAGCDCAGSYSGQMS